MATEESQYPILVDTDALIAVGNSSLWDCITENIGLTTTNVCQQELKRHYEQNRSHAPEGSRSYRLHHGSTRVLDALEDTETPLTRVVSVPRPHGADAGEQSLEQHLVQHPKAVDYVVLMDAHGRRSIRREIQNRDLEARVVPPTFSSTFSTITISSREQRFVKRVLNFSKAKGGQAITPSMLRGGDSSRLLRRH